MKRTLKSKFVLSIFLIVLVVLIVAMSATLILSVQVFRTTSEQSLEQAAQLGQQEVAAWFAEKEQYLETIRGDISANYQLGQKDAIEARLATYNSEFSDLEQVFIGTVTNEFYSSVFWEPEEGYDCRVRDWYTHTREKNGLHYTLPYLDFTTNTIVVSLCAPLNDSTGQDMGVVGIDLHLDTLVSFIDKDTIMNTSGRAFLMDSSENFITHENAAFLPAYSNGTESYSSFGDSGITEGKNISDQNLRLSKGYDWDGTRAYIAVAQVGSNSWSYGFAVPVSDFNATYLRLAMGFVVIAVIVVIVAILASARITGRLLVPIQIMIEAASRIAVGDVELDLQIHTGDELEELADKFTQMAASTSRQIAVMEAMSQGDFSGRIEPKCQRDRLSITMNEVIGNLRNLVAEVRGSVSQVSIGVDQIASGAQLLAQGSIQQSVAVEQLSGSLDKILTGSRDSAESSRNANHTVLSIRDTVNEGVGAMEGMVQAVQEINDASFDISKIIKVIEDIAFQTNILALNAAVEAARAGQHGKGFAVVADEVRNLAEKSAAAARETETLIQSSAAKAGEGVNAAQRTRAILHGIVDRMDAIAEMIQHVDTVTETQLEEVNSIAQNVAQISQVVHQNSATAEQAAAASEELSANAQALDATMSAFNTGDSVSGSGMALAGLDTGFELSGNGFQLSGR